MLQKQFRLNLKTDFKRVANGKRIENSFVIMFINQGLENVSRIGIATSSKVFKKAHERNKARRIISAAFEQIYEGINLGIDIVALPKLRVLDVKSTEVKDSLINSLKQANSYHEDISS